MKYILIGVLIVAVIIYFFTPIIRGGKKIGEKVSSESIRKIDLGMDKEEVINILGNPSQVKRYFHPYVYNDTSKLFIKKSSDTEFDSVIVFIYGEPVEYARWYPMLWVHFNNENKVRQVYAKRYTLWGISDKGVYTLSNIRRSEGIMFEETFN